MPKIKDIKAQEILDSRGNPTIEVCVTLDDNSIGVASVPQGASTGKNEALELNDGNPKRYFGLGKEKSVQNVNKKITRSLKGKEATDQKKIDQTLIKLDGTKNKSKLGANSILGTSLAVCRAASNSRSEALYQYIQKLSNLFTPSKVEEQLITYNLPVPMFNILNGGKHADNNLDVQEFMVIPLNSPSFKEALRMGTEVYHSLKEVLRNRGLIVAVGDEGGFTPNLEADTQGLDFLKEAVSKAQYKIGEEIGLGIDVAASNWFSGKDYYMTSRDIHLSSSQMVSLYNDWITNYPIVLIEDGLAEDDWDSWVEMKERIDDKILVIGDDLFVTNPNRIKKGIRLKVASGTIIKPNQIGTLTEVLEAVEVAKRGGLKIVVSHRSGETNDDFIADLAVGVGADYIKAGAPCRGERLVKYNRLLKIEEEIENIK